MAESTIKSIVSSGSNANGRWTKFADGTMICTKKWSGTVNVATAWGNMYESASRVDFGNWAQEFYDVPIVASTPNGEACILETLSSSTTKTAIGTSYVLRPVSKNNCDVGFHFIGIGRWRA